MNDPSINPQLIPQPPTTHNHRYLFLWSVLVIVIVAILIALAYWFIVMRYASITPPKTQAELRTEVAAMLQSSQPASAAKISAVSSLLSNSKATSSAEKRQNIANILNGK